MKDTTAVKAANTLIKYCAQFKECNKKCIFYNEECHLSPCNINGMPWKYREIKGGNKP